MTTSIKCKKLRLGFIYGVVAGVAFAITAWGVDAWILTRANATNSWYKFLLGIVFCIIVGGLAGWLTILFDKHGNAVLFWALLAILYSWLIIWMPFTGYQSLLIKANPDLAQYIHFSQIQDIDQIRLVSTLVIGLASTLAGLLEINLVHQASVSSHGFALVTAMLVCLVLFAVAGSAVDQMINTNTREPVVVINNLLQFAAENQGVDVPRQTARKMHLSAANQLGEIIQNERRLTLIGYDQNLGMIDVLVDFDGTLAKCSAIYSQPTDCIILTPNQ